MTLIKSWTQPVSDCTTSVLRLSDVCDEGVVNRRTTLETSARIILLHHRHVFNRPDWDQDLSSVCDLLQAFSFIDR